MDKNTQRDMLICIIKKAMNANMDIPEDMDDFALLYSDDFDHIAEDAADEILANGIGDIESYKIEAEYWEKSYNEEHIKYVNFVKNEARDMKNMMKSRDEWKRRAEVAEQKYKIALEKVCHTFQKYPKHYQTALKRFDDEITRQAEREIAEEKRK